MSYNTRRNQSFGSNSSGNLGQRRPVGNNFVSGFVPGGQLAGSQQQRPQGQQQQQRTPQQQQGGNRPQPQGQSYQSQSYNNQSQLTPTKPAAQQFKNEVKQQSTPVQQQQQTPAKPVVQQQQTPAKQEQQPAAAVPAETPSESQEEQMDTTGNGDAPKRKFWPKRTGNKITRAERARRRNLKLSKILQPKNAVMILNELIKGCVYNVEEVPVKIDVNQFRGTVSFEGLEFAGTGKNKNAAKNAAAETALKHLVKNKKIGTLKKEGEEDEEGDDKMEVGEDDTTPQVMPWSHIASFAMFKLFSAWGEDPNAVKVCEENTQQDSQGNATASPSVGRDPKPAKKMPDNPESLNPLMLMHQMLPSAVWEEVGKSGNPPNIIFQMKVTIGDSSFTGTGANKKLAKKMAAFSACHELLEVNYPAEVWDAC